MRRVDGGQYAQCVLCLLVRTKNKLYLRRACCVVQLGLAEELKGPNGGSKRHLDLAIPAVGQRGQSSNRGPDPGHLGLSDF